MKNSMSYSQNVRQERIRVNNHGSFSNNPQGRLRNNTQTRASINGFSHQTNTTKKPQQQPQTSPRPQQPNIQPPTSTYYHNLPLSHPLSPNGKRIQQQLQLFRFDQKIQEIQSQEILQLIEQHIRMQNQRKEDMVKEVMGRTAYERQNFNRSNAFRLYKNASFSRAKAKGNEERNERYVQVRNVRTNESFKKEKEGQDQEKYHEQTNPEKHNIVTCQKQKSQARQPSTQPHRSTKPSLPLWQRNLFHQKLLLKQHSKSLHTTKPNQFFPSSKLTNTSLFSPSPQNIQHSLSQLYNKSFSLTKNYQFYLNAKGHKLNPQTKKQLMEQLKISRQDEKLLLDSRNKSFAGYSKVKSMMYSTKAQMLYNSTSAGCNHDSGYNHSQHNSHNHNQNHGNVQTDSSLTSHKLTYLRPIKLSKHSKNHLLLFQPPHNPRAHRIHNLASSNNQQQQQYQSQTQNQYIKFRETYKDKLTDDKQLQKFLSQRNKKSRQAISPYHHQLSAWN